MRIVERRRVFNRRQGDAERVSEKINLAAVFFLHLLVGEDVVREVMCILLQERVDELVEF